VFCAVLVLSSCAQKEDSSEAAPGGGEIAWTVPDGWVEEPPSNAMRKAQFVLPAAEGDSEDATVVITHFPGDGAVGGIEANIQRWYGQMKQPDGKPTSEVAETKRDKVNGIEQVRVSMTGTYSGGMTMGGHGSPEKPGFKMVSTIVRASAGPYFVKMTGPEATVAKWEKSYDGFLASFEER
jgi:hypothetical protein